MQKYTNQGPLKFLKLANDLVSSLNHFLSAKNNPNKYSWDSETIFSQQDFQNAIFLIFFGKILWRRNKFQLTIYLFYAEISYEIKGLRFDQMKFSGRGTEPKKTEMMYFQQSIRDSISSTWLKVTERSPVRLGKLISFTENLKNKKLQKIFFENCFRKKISLGKSHSVEITKTGQLSQKY